MIQYKWTISAMENYPKADGLDNVVFQVHYRRSATEVDADKTWFAETYSVLNLPAPSPEDYTPYEQLTFEQVCGWLESAMDVTAIDASLASQIEEQKNPKVLQLPLPWVKETKVDETLSSNETK